jgi:hypothetical protein
VELRVDAAGTPGDRERELRFSICANADRVAATTSGAFLQSMRVPSRWTDRTWLLWLRVALTLLAATLLIAGSFAHWTNGGDTPLTGVCAEGGVSLCLDYADTINAVAKTDLVSTPPNDLPGPVYFVGSAGFLTILLGVVALAGLRRGRSTWVAGVVALVALTVLAVQANAESGIAIPMFGSVLAIVAGFLPVLADEGG